MIVVPTDTPGYNIVRDVPVMGMYGGHCEVVYDQVRVPRQNLLGAARRRLPDRPAAPRARAASSTACAGSARRSAPST